MPAVRWMPMRRGREWTKFYAATRDEHELTVALLDLKFPGVRIDPQERNVLASIRIEEA